MTCRDDHSYYIARAHQEAKIGEASANQKVAAIHFEMAYRYAVLAHWVPVQVTRNGTSAQVTEALRSASNVGHLEQAHRLTMVRQEA